MIEDFARAARAQLREEIENRREDLGNGQCGDFHEYKRLVGVIQGLTTAMSIIENLAKRAIEDDDNDA